MSFSEHYTRFRENFDRPSSDMTYREEMERMMGPNRSWTVISPAKTTPKATTPKATTSNWTKVDPVIMESDSQKQGKNYLTSQLASGVKKYGGQRTAENQYAGRLDQSLTDYLNRTQPGSVGAAENLLQETLTGKFDPNTSQYYQGVRESADLNLNDALNRYARQQYMKGSLRSTPTDVGRARILSENQANLNQILGNLAMQERQNQFGAVGQSLDMARYMSGEKAGDISAIQNVGGYLTRQKQEGLDREYEDWKLQQEREQGLAQLLFQEPVTYAYPQYQYTGA